jgi:octaprenyl-diphosphate synthase
MDIAALLEDVQPDLARVEEEILRHLSTEIPLLNEVGKYILASGGKRLRPAVSLYASKIFGGAGDAVVVAAAALEYLHTATLLHDDVVDGAETRRSQKAARMVWGNQASVLVGDYLLATAFRSLTLLGNAKVLDVISHSTTLMAKGEILQLVRRYDTATEGDYLAIIVHKTACLFAAAAQIGACYAGAGEAEQLALYGYGNELGIAFQIVDDALDYVEERGKIGKPLGIDLKERKVTLPLSRLMKVAAPAERTRLLAMLGQPAIGDDDVREVIALMAAHRVLPYTLSEARRYAERAKEHLAALPVGRPRSTLAQLADFVVEREL